MVIKHNANLFHWDIKFPRFLRYKRSGKQVKKFQSFTELQNSRRLVRKITFRRYYEFPKMPKIYHRKEKYGFIRKRS